ncbi:MAG TPA: hypothetical protein VIG47_16215 [Gemmatimonadaceae bacterium]
MSFTNKLIGFALLTGCATQLVAQLPVRDLAPYLIPDRAAEIALARSAAPAAISDSAAVLVLTRAGYVNAAHGPNGFVCIVLRGFAGPLSNDSSWWNPKVRAPLCLNPAAVRSVLPEMKQRAALVMAGTPASDIVARIYREYASHQLTMPADGAMTYMMSHNQYLADENPPWKPHLMFFYGGGRNGAEWGAGNEAPIIDGGVDKKSGISIMLIPVSHWSDGTPFSG